MMTTDDDRELEELTEQECLQLLASRSVGRIAVNIPNDGPLVVPVNYTLGQGVILFRSAYGTKLRTLPSRPVSFQVDDIDRVGRTGWSLLARGRAREIHSRDADGRLPDPWVPDDKPYLVRLKIRAITGRRVRHRTQTVPTLRPEQGEHAEGSDDNILGTPNIY